jgi:hypothetical protein
MLGGPEGLLNRPKLLAAQHGIKRLKIGLSTIWSQSDWEAKGGARFNCSQVVLSLLRQGLPCLATNVPGSNHARVSSSAMWVSFAPRWDSA